MNPLNNLRMEMKEALTNMWNRISARIEAIEEGGGGEANVIEAISFNGTDVPPDANKNVALVESDPTVPSWAKQSSKPTYTAQEVGAQADVGLYIDAQGYLCQRIGSD